MKQLLRCICLLLPLWLPGCRERVFVDRVAQRVTVTNFSAPVRTTLPTVSYNPVKITIKINGTVSRPVTLSVSELSQVRSPVSLLTPIIIPAGSYVDRVFEEDFYNNQRLELLVTGEPGTTGFLNIEWYR